MAKAGSSRILKETAEAIAAARRAKEDTPKVKAAPKVGVTAEREGHNKFRSAGMARKVVPVIETLLDAGKLTSAEYEALAYYRDQASRAEDDVAQHGTLSPEKIMGGGGSLMGGTIPARLLATPAILETARIERDLGSLANIARAVAVDDWSLSRWCIHLHGGRERYDGKGRFVAMVPNAEKRNIDLARVELKFAARRISR